MLPCEWSRLVKVQPAFALQLSPLAECIEVGAGRGVLALRDFSPGDAATTVASPKSVVFPRPGASPRRMLIEERLTNRRRLRVSGRRLDPLALRDGGANFRIFAVSGRYDKGQPADPLFRDNNQHLLGPVSHQKKISVGELCEKFIAAKSQVWAKKTIYDNKRVVRWFRELAGEGTPIDAVTIETVSYSPGIGH